MLSTTNTKMLVFQLQSYYTFNIILHATLKIFHFRGVGSEIIPNLKFPYNGNLFQKLYHLQNCQQLLKLSRLNCPRMLFHSCLKQSSWGCQNLNWTCSWRKSGLKLALLSKTERKKKWGVVREKNFHMDKLPKLTLCEILSASAGKGNTQRGGGGKAGYQRTLPWKYVGISSPWE